MRVFFWARCTDMALISSRSVVSGNNEDGAPHSCIVAGHHLTAPVVTGARPRRRALGPDLDRGADSRPPCRSLVAQQIAAERGQAQPARVTLVRACILLRLDGER